MPANTNTKSKLQRTTERLERVTGATVQVERPDWIALMQQGVIVKLHIRRWRAKTQVIFMDLGLPQPKTEGEQAVYEDLISLGSKRLLPAEYIQRPDSIDSAARKWLHSISHQTYWGDFVLLSRYTEFKTGIEERKAAYMAIPAEIDLKWDAIMEQLIDAYAVSAATAYERLLLLMANKTPTTTSEAITITKEIRRNVSKLGTKNNFVDAFMSRITDAIPTRDEVVESFAFEVELSHIPLPSLLAEDLAKRDQIENRRQLANRDAQSRLRMMDDQEQAMRRMNDDVVREARDNWRQQADQFARDIQAKATGILYEGFANVLESMQKNDGRLIGKAADQVRSIAETWRAMNPFTNADLDTQIAKVAELMETPSRQRNSADVQRLLREIGTTARANLVALGTTPRSARSVGISDRVEPLTLKRARRSVVLLAAAEENLREPRL